MRRSGGASATISISTSISAAGSISGSGSGSISDRVAIGSGTAARVVATIVVAVTMLMMTAEVVRDAQVSELHVGGPYVASVIAIVFGATAAVAALLGALGRATLDPVE